MSKFDVIIERNYFNECVFNLNITTDAWRSKNQYLEEISLEQLEIVRDSITRFIDENKEKPE